ncbi:hypothetical protein THAOC_10194, partial [Thalassiosira oceanica]
MDDGHTSSAELQEMYRVNQRTASDDHAPIGPTLRHCPDEEVDEGESSLLRGHIMAARSAVSFAGGRDDKDSVDGGSEDDARENLGTKTPSKARAEQEVDVATGITPSRARSEAVYELPPSGRRHAAEATPSMLRREMTTPARSSSRPPLQSLRTAEAVDHDMERGSVPETPSNQRRNFLASPQDSVSTMGSASPTATAGLAHG